MQWASATGAHQVAADSSSGAVQQTSRTASLGAGGFKDEVPAGCFAQSVDGQDPPLSYPQAPDPASSAHPTVIPKPHPPLGDVEPPINARAVPMVADWDSQTVGFGTIQAADADGCVTIGKIAHALVPSRTTLPVAGAGDKLLTAVQAAAYVPVVTGSTCPPTDSNATASGPPAPEQLVQSCDCDCKGVTGGQACSGRGCVNLGGQPLPQVIHSLLQMVQQLQAGNGKQQQLLRSMLQAAEQQAKDLARAKAEADSNLDEAQTILQQLKQQNQASQQQQLEQHEKLRAAVEEMRRQRTTEQEQLAVAQSQLAPLNSSSSSNSSSSASPGSGSGAIQAAQAALPGPITDQCCASRGFPVGCGSVEQRECLDQLSIAINQLTNVMVMGGVLQNPLVQDVLEAAKRSLDGAAALISSWDRHSCAAALHHHVLITALAVAQQQVDWYQHSAGAELTNYLACLTSCPEARRTGLHVAMQQLQQAKSSTLFLVAQQQAPSHLATWKASYYIKGIGQHMQGQLEQQLGLSSPYIAGQVWRPQLVAVAAAMTRVNLLLASLQSSCPGLQLVSRLEECVTGQDGTGACEAPVRQLLGMVESSRPLFLVRPGLVCAAAAGGGRQVLVRQQAVALVPDWAGWEQQRLEAEAAERQRAERVLLEAEGAKYRGELEEEGLLEEQVAGVPGSLPHISCSKEQGPEPWWSRWLPWP